MTIKNIVSPALLFSALAFASPWTGQLIDATCYDAKKQTSTQQCDVTDATNSFGLLVDGKVYKLDPTGSSQAAQIVKTQAEDKSKVMAKVTGELEGDTITVKTVEIQK